MAIRIKLGGLGRAGHASVNQIGQKIEISAIAGSWFRFRLLCSPTVLETGGDFAVLPSLLREEPWLVTVFNR